jgi:hypothetical protein
VEHGEIDAAVLERLCESGPWTRQELEREFSIQGHDAAGRLGAKGMAHRVEGFVFASVSGRYAMRSRRSEIERVLPGLR